MAAERESYLVPVQNHPYLPASQNYYRNRKSQVAEHLMYSKKFCFIFMFKAEHRTQIYSQ